MLEKGVIKPAQSTWAAPDVLAPKPDGSLRFCVHYPNLIAMTVRGNYRLPRMDVCIDGLGEAQIFTALDANWDYWQMPVAERDQDKPAFVFHAGLYRFTRMLSGLTNAPETFQRDLDIRLASYK